MPQPTSSTWTISSRNSGPWALANALSCNCSPIIPGVSIASLRSKWVFTLWAAPQFANHFDDHAPALRSNLIEVHTFLTYEKQFRNLQLQFGRLCRQREKDTAELRQLQQERNTREKEQLETAAKLYTAAKHDRKPFDPAEYGFDCSTEDVECYLQGVRAAHLFNATLKQEREQAKLRATAA
jgi:hypothetical protein